MKTSKTMGKKCGKEKKTKIFLTKTTLNLLIFVSECKCVCEMACSQKHEEKKKPKDILTYTHTDHEKKLLSFKLFLGIGTSCTMSFIMFVRLFQCILSLAFVTKEKLWNRIQYYIERELVFFVISVFEQWILLTFIFLMDENFDADKSQKNREKKWRRKLRKKNNKNSNNNKTNTFYTKDKEMKKSNHFGK